MCHQYSHICSFGETRAFPAYSAYKLWLRKQHYNKGLIYVSQVDKDNTQKMVDELKSLDAKNVASLDESVNNL